MYQAEIDLIGNSTKSNMKRYALIRQDGNEFTMEALRDSDKAICHGRGIMSH
jgi:hypothetical protein